MRVSGWGLLSPMLVFLGFPAAGLAVKQLPRGPLKLLLFTLLAVAAANQWLALRLNARRAWATGGRRWAAGGRRQLLRPALRWLLLGRSPAVAGTAASGRRGRPGGRLRRRGTGGGVRHHQQGRGHHRGDVRGMRRVG
jgi:hypothetical protein